MKMRVLENACVEDPCAADCVDLCDACVENASVEDACACVEDACVRN